MYYYNIIKFSFESNEHAERAKNVIADTLRAGKFDTDEYFRIFDMEDLIEALSFVEDHTLSTPDEAPYFSTEGSDIFLKSLCIALAESLNSDFTFETFHTNEYTELWFEGEYKEGVLSCTSTYWPSGYMEHLLCPECAEDIVLLEEYNPNETYICPECGEEIDLAEAYEETAPQITKEEIRVH